MNQTLSTRVTNDNAGIDMAVVANLYSLQLAGSTSDVWEYSINLAAVANSRRGIDYSMVSGAPGSYPCTPSNFYGNALPNSRQLGDNEGFWVLLGGLYVWYYGTWYDRAFVTENGFLTFDEHAANDNGGKWTSPSPPSTIPSANDGRPDDIVAPFWRDLKGGTVKWGSLYTGYFEIAWIGPTDPNGKAQYFSISFRTTLYFNDRVYSEIKFNYCSVQDSQYAKVGIEDQAGTRGKSWFAPYTNSYLIFDAGTTKGPFNGVWTSINGIRVYAHDYYSDPGGTYTTDPTASIRIGGTYTINPVGINVDIIPTSRGTLDQYAYQGRWDKTGKFILDLAGYVPYLGAILSVPGTIQRYNEMVDAWANVTPERTEKQEIQFGDSLSLAYVRSKANEEIFPDGAGYTFNSTVWDISLAPTISWLIQKPESTVNANKVHYIDLWAELAITPYSCSTCSATIASQKFTIKLQPYISPSGTAQRVSWFARSNPDGHYANFRPLLPSEMQGLPAGVTAGYHIDTIGSADSGYKMFGWNKLTRYGSQDHTLDSNGRILVHGYFRQYGNPPGGPQVNLYVISSAYSQQGQPIDDKLDNIVATVPVLNRAYQTGVWYERYIAVDLGAAWHDTPVKIGIGRSKDTSIDYGLQVEWAGVALLAGASSGGQPLPPVVKFSVLASGASGSTAVSPVQNVTGQTYYYVKDTTLTLTATAASGFIFHDFNFDGTTIYYDDPHAATASTDHVVYSHFAAPLTTLLASGSGSVNPLGTAYYIYGTSVTVAATPATGYRFGYWNFDGVSALCSTPTSTCSYSVLIDKPHTLKVNFVALSQRVLIVAVNDASKGATTPAAGTYVKGSIDTVSVTAAATTGNKFSYWLLDGTKYTNNPISFSMNSNDHTLKAYFVTSGGGGCVAEGTLVTMADGSTKAVEKIRIGDRILGYDVDTQSFVVETVEALSSTKVGEILNFNDGALRTTPVDQPIYVRTPQGESWVHDPMVIEIGWELFNPIEKTWIKIVSITHEDGKFKVFDFTTDGPRTYLANSVLVLDKPIPQ